MKICIVTPYDSANHGAYLQAYASKIFLEEMGHEVFFLKWRSKKERLQEFFAKPRSIKLAIRFLQKLPFLFNKYHAFNEAILNIPTIELEQINQMDAVIVGSDEVWNLEVHKFQKDCFYFDGMPNKLKRFAYAPSVGNTTIKEFNKFPNICDAIKSIDIIGVRDQATKDIVKEITGEDVSLVCDPTLLVDFNKWKFPKINNNIGKYILVYSYDVPKLHRDKLISIARNNGLKLVALGLYQSWCDYNINCNPMEFSGYISNADSVYTTTFHGTIFTLLNHKRCAVYAKSQKLIDLIEQYGMKEVTITEDISQDDLERKMMSKFDSDIFESNLIEKRKYSKSIYEEKIGKIINE